LRFVTRSALHDYPHARHLSNEWRGKSTRDLKGKGARGVRRHALRHVLRHAPASCAEHRCLELRSVCTHIRAFIYSIVYVTYAIDKCAHMRETERTLGQPL